jgi:hypothetical protein
MVEVFVGPTRRPFVLHKDLLYALPSLRISTERSTAISKKQHCNHTTYRDQKTSPKPSRSSCHGCTVVVSQIIARPLPARAHSTLLSSGFCILADKFILAKDVQVQALDALLKAYLTEPGEFVLRSSTINSVLLSTAEDFPLRYLIVDMMWDSYNKPAVDSDWLEGCLDGFPMADSQGMSFLERRKSALVAVQSKPLEGDDQKRQECCGYQTVSDRYDEGRDFGSLDAEVRHLTSVKDG